MSQPIVLTCGDPAGIGPEIAMAARLGCDIPFAWIGDPRHLPQGSVYRLISAPAQALGVAADHLPVIFHEFAAPARAGKPDPANAQGVIDVIARAVTLARSGAAGGICTAPINKKALYDGADFAFPGHTEFLAHLGGIKTPVMMLAAQDLRVVPVTIHIPLDRVAAALTPDLLRETILITHGALIRDFGTARPRLAVAGLNPHAGEGGAMGTAEITLITPVLDDLRARGLDIIGPLPADTMFHPRARARYDAAICMYHDQALIPIKTIDFDGGVNVTLGLPFIRTSPDHGTAYDIAGRGIARPDSLIAALRLAHEMAQHGHD